MQCRGSLTAAALPNRLVTTSASRVISLVTTGVISLGELPHIDEFESVYFDRVPVLIKGAVAHWPAMQRWQDTNYLRSVAGDVTVPVEIGGDYLSSSLHKADMPLSLYLDYLEAADASGSEVPLEQMAYMAQASVDELLHDVEVPVLCAELGRRDRFATMVWMGPKGTVTPLHRDPYHNCLCQIQGTKRILLFSRDDEDKMYPISEAMNPLQTNSSQVNVEAPDLVRFPKFAAAAPLIAELDPGDLLYIPRRWWHHVRSTARSTSLSFWWL